ncbi:MAG: hypothetical protein SWY16_09810 [Cyanobacteriota bacterium]|nr:hypothetical protein [Cyanobacteriota bacterium]
MPSFSLPYLNKAPNKVPIVDRTLNLLFNVYSRSSVLQPPSIINLAVAMLGDFVQRRVEGI